MKPRLRVLISSGPTREPIDPVRYLSNYSTGTMGAALAAEALRRGHRVTVVSGPVEVAPPRGARVIWIERARQMQAALRRELARADALIMAAAVSDFEPARTHAKKLPRAGTRMLRLHATPDVVGSLPRRSGQVFVGFALETAQAVARAMRKRTAKRLDLIVGQSVRPGHSPFGAQPLDAFLVDCSGVRRLGRVGKAALARRVLDETEQLWYGTLPCAGSSSDNPLPLRRRRRTAATNQHGAAITR